MAVATPSPSPGPSAPESLVPAISLGDHTLLFYIGLGALALAVVMFAAMILWAVVRSRLRARKPLAGVIREHGRHDPSSDSSGVELEPLQDDAPSDARSLAATTPPRPAIVLDEDAMIPTSPRSPRSTDGEAYEKI